jgi:dihydroorotate dehydrogenase
MSPVLASALLPVLRRIDPELAHRAALAGLRWGLAGGTPVEDDPALRVTALGLAFSNPIGLAAGFDKDAVAVAGLTRLGFGFVETGTVTPRPQPGNPRPRLFRLEAERAVINRMGFNNGGLDAYLARLDVLPRGAVPVGANVGINKEGADPERDYSSLVAAVARRADYVVINVSSPNTPGLRDLQGEGRLRSILAAVAECVKQRPPLLVKLAPDLSDAGLAALVEVCAEARVDGLIISNTTIARPDGLRSPHARQAGGLSGPPLFARSTAMLARAHLLARGRLVLIGAGGVSSGRDAWTKIRAGARLVQLYTAFAYDGPALLPRLKAELAAAMREAGFARVEDAVGTDASNLAGST